MRYYKLISGTNFVGIGTSYDMLRYQQKHRVLLRCDVSEAQYIRYKDQLYRATWMVPEVADVESVDLDVIEIDVNEYDALANAIEAEEEIVVVPEPEYPVEPEVQEPSPTIEYVRSMKILSLSHECNQIIEAGFDVELSDGIIYHFSLTTQDQLNLLSLSGLVASGATTIPYHADGELCKYYSAEDMIIITTKATEFKTYHTSYFNSLKNWVSMLDSIDTIDSIYYGISVPEEYCSVVLNQLNQSLMEVN